MEAVLSWLGIGIIGTWNTLLFIAKINIALLTANVLTVAVVYKLLGINSFEDRIKLIFKGTISSTVLFLFLAAAFEELLFRFIPIYLALKIWGPSLPMLVVILVSSVIFGYLHGDSRHIFMQGIGGIVWSIIFLKCGGLQGHLLSAFWWVICAHVSFNFLAVLLSVVSGAASNRHDAQITKRAK